MKPCPRPDLKCKYMKKDKTCKLNPKERLHDNLCPIWQETFKALGFKR